MKAAGKLPPRSEYVAGLERGLAIIEAFGTSQSVLTLAEAAKIAGYSRASARRCLRTLEALGYARFDGKYFSLAPRVLRLGNAYVQSNPLTRAVQSVIEAAGERARETTSVTVLDDTDVILIARALVRRSLAGGLVVGGRIPIYCSANGHALLSGLPDDQVKALLARIPRPKLTPHTRCEIKEIMRAVALVRTRGFAINDQEVEIGLQTMAVPVRDRQGRVIASLSQSVTGLKGSLVEVVKRRLPQLETARARLDGLL
jgi:IclR family transcriptional regulator, pca regulon regulatory protein